MSLRYETPEESPEEQRRAAEERHAMWDTLASEVTSKDPAFRWWKMRHWTLYGCLSGILFLATMLAAIANHDKAHPNPRAFGAPFVVAAFPLGFGAWLYSARIRKIALVEWSKSRQREVLGKKPNKAPEPTSGTVTPRAEPRVAPVPPVAHL